MSMRGRKGGRKCGGGGEKERLRTRLLVIYFCATYGECPSLLSVDVVNTITKQREENGLFHLPLLGHNSLWPEVRTRMKVRLLKQRTLKVLAYFF